MKHKRNHVTLLLFAAVVFVATFNEAASFSGGALVLGNDTGYAGGPAEQGRTCATAGCHSSATPIAQEGWLTIDADSLGYMGDSLYTLTLRATDPNASTFGFMASPQNSSGNQMGGFIAGGAGLEVKGGSKYITHTVPNVDGSGTMTWSFQWLAPSAGSGPVTFYAAINAANNDGGTFGDQIHTTTLTLPERPVRDQLTLFPNPATTHVTVAGLDDATSTSTLHVVNVAGQHMGGVNLEPVHGELRLDISQLPAGVYFVQVDGAASSRIKFVKIAD